MDVNKPLPLLAGLSPAQFMRRHWQKKPLLVRNAIADFKPVLSRTALFKLAANEQVESRLITQGGSGAWTLKSGPFAGRLPPLAKSGWTLLVQGLDLHNAAAHELLQRFRFVPDARLDDLMVSFATPGGGVGPHFDSYDVFLLQASGRRRWKISRQKDLTLQAGAPLKILKNFEAEEEFVLEAGDMLYLPPRYAHDGVAESLLDGGGNDCMTYSIGFRAPARNELAAELLHRLAEFNEDEDVSSLDAGDEASGVKPMPRKLYGDANQIATASPAALPPQLEAFAREAIADALRDPLAIACVLGEYMTEPKPSVWFDETMQAWDPMADQAGVELAAQTRMMYDAHHVFINGESHRAKGADARLMRALADQRGLTAAQLAKAGTAAIGLLAEWHEAGWLRSGRTRPQ